jgi:predicted SAM-dependent methyltransferase
MKIRPITSYSKVQRWIGAIVRNKKMQLACSKVRTTPYLDLGCGQNCHSGLINLDYNWHPGVDVCWDIRNGLPFKNGRLRGIFSEHCFEHFPLPTIFFIIKECRRTLQVDGILRIVVPDAGMYLERYYERTRQKSAELFPFESQESFEGIYTPILSVNRIFYQDREQAFGHQAMYDFQLLEKLLRKAGFGRVEKKSYREGKDPCLLIDTESRKAESLYIEAF